MTKTLSGIVISIKMKDTVIVEVSRRKPHPLYRKLLTKSKKFKVGLNGTSVQKGDTVTIAETRPTAGNKHFVIVTKEGVK